MLKPTATAEHPLSQLVARSLEPHVLDYRRDPVAEATEWRTALTKATKAFLTGPTPSPLRATMPEAATSVRDAVYIALGDQLSTLCVGAGVALFELTAKAAKSFQADYKPERGSRNLSPRAIQAIAGLSAAIKKAEDVLGDDDAPSRHWTVREPRWGT